MADKIIEIRYPEKGSVRYGSAAITLFVAIFVLALAAVVGGAIKVSPPQSAPSVDQSHTQAPPAPTAP